MPDIGIAEVLELTGVGKASLYRWMSEHPTLAKADADSQVGHPFPKPTRKQGREVLWNEDVVKNWWEANSTLVGRHPEGCTVVMPWPRFRKAMLKRPRVFSNDDGSEIVEDHMDMVESFDRRLDDARVRFRSVEDAIWFKLKYR